MAELWDVHDINRNKTGRLHERGKSDMVDGDFLLIVFVWIRNNKGEFLISKRADGRSRSGMWQTTMGCAIAGDDSLSAALRETEEELGIVLNPKNGQLFKQFTHGNLFDMWLFSHEADISEVVLQPDETCDAMWVSEKSLKQMISEGVFWGEWQPYFDELS